MIPRPSAHACALALACAALPALAAEPDWVKGGGLSPRFPAQVFLTGFSLAEGPDALEKARRGAATDLATRVTVRIEHEVADSSAEKNGAGSYSISSLTRATTDVRLANLAYETHQEGGKAWALAFQKRAEAATQKRGERDQALSRGKELLAAGEKAEKEKREADALAALYQARVRLQEAIEADAIARAIGGAEGAPVEVAPLFAQADEKVRLLLKKPVSSLDDAVGALALQLGQQGVTASRFTVAPLTFGTTPFSSAFGRQVGLLLEQALAAQPAPAGAHAQGDVAVRGTYVQLSGALRLLLVAREAKGGRAVASAETSLPEKAVPPGLMVLPQNYADALKDQRLLAAGEEVSGDLRVELWTNKGRTGLVFARKEEVAINLRVNRPAWVRLVYLLASGQKVMLEQAYYLDASKVNLAVEYPSKFEVSPPFGVEQLHATAFTEKPEPLAVRKVAVEGEEYEVVAEGMEAMVRHRGLKAKKGPAQSAEATLALTTTAQ